MDGYYDIDYPRKTNKRGDRLRGQCIIRLIYYLIIQKIHLKMYSDVTLMFTVYVLHNLVLLFGV